MIDFRKKQRQARADEVDLMQFPRRDWTAQVGWGPKTRGGPPKERVDSLLSIMPVFRAGVTRGVADAKALWPEVVPSGQWGSGTDPAEWDGKWKCAKWAWASILVWSTSWPKCTPGWALEEPNLCRSVVKGSQYMRQERTSGPDEKG